MPDLTGNFETGRLPRIAPGAVTVAIERRADPHRRGQFDEWLVAMVDAVQNAEGCLGATVLAPASPSDAHHIVFRFVDAIHLRKWERSEVRQALLERGDGLFVSERVTVTAGTEEFFSALGEVQHHRTRFGAFISDVAWVYPVALVFSVGLAPWFARIDVIPRVLISTALIGATSKYATGPVKRWWRRRHMLPQNASVR